METVHARVRQLSPMIGLIKDHQLFEGRSSAIQREDGNLDETPIHRANGEVTIKRELLVDFNETNHGAPAKARAQFRRISSARETRC